MEKRMSRIIYDDELENGLNSEKKGQYVFEFCFTFLEAIDNLPNKVKEKLRHIGVNYQSLKNTNIMCYVNNIKDLKKINDIFYSIETLKKIEEDN